MASLEHALTFVPRNLAIQIGFVPLEYDGSTLTIALVKSDIMPTAAIEKNLATRFGKRVVAIEKPREEVLALIEERYFKKASDVASTTHAPTPTPLHAPAPPPPANAPEVNMQAPAPPSKVTPIPGYLIPDDIGKIDTTVSEPKAIKLIDRKTAYRYDALALSHRDGMLYVGLVSDNDQVVLDDLRMITKCQIVPIKMPQVEILKRLKEVYAQDKTEVDTLKPMERIILDIWSTAVHKRASDVHFDALKDGGRILFNIDGELTAYTNLTRETHAAVVSSIMLKADMDSSNKLKPQSGRLSEGIDGKTVDIRLQVIPSIHGMSMVGRIMPSNDSIATLEERGMTAEFAARFRRTIKQPYGMILIAGPMGSGKTNTMYSSLLDIRDEKIAFRSVENPVEMQLPWVQQTTLRDNDAFSFPEALSAFVRLNPKVIIVGEMRDEETARKGLEAAMLGHLVFATSHGNDSAAVIQRLTNMGVGRDDIAAALSAVLSQRLVRRLCMSCRTPSSVPADLGRFATAYTARTHRTPTVYRARGCEICDYSGYVGRIGVFELLDVTNDVKQAILDGKLAFNVLKTDPDFEPLIIDGIHKIFSGDTTAEQIQKIARWNLDEAFSFYNTATQRPTLVPSSGA